MRTTIIEAQPRHIPAIAELQARLALPDLAQYTDQQRQTILQDMLRSAQSGHALGLAVAVSGQTVLGFVMCLPATPGPPQPSWHDYSMLEQLAVAEGHEGKGIGKELVKHARLWTGPNKRLGLIAEVSDALVPFHVAAGFADCERDHSVAWIASDGLARTRRNEPANGGQYDRLVLMETNRSAAYTWPFPDPPAAPDHAVVQAVHKALPQRLAVMPPHTKTKPYVREYIKRTRLAVRV